MSDLNRDVTHVRYAAIGAGFLVALVTTGLQAAVLTVWKGDAAATLLDVFVRTAPLTLAVAIIVRWSADFWHGRVQVFEGHPPFQFLVWIGVVSMILYDARAVGDLLGDHVETQRVLAPAQGGGVMYVAGQRAVAAIVNSVAGYYQTYGFAKFTSALVLGAFVAFAWWRLGRHAPGAAATRAVLYVGTVGLFVGFCWYEPSPPKPAPRPFPWRAHDGPGPPIELRPSGGSSP
jgi:hypothetical protein